MWLAVWSGINYKWIQICAYLVWQFDEPCVEFRHSSISETALNEHGRNIFGGFCINVERSVQSPGCVELFGPLTLEIDRINKDEFRIRGDAVCN